MKKGSTAHVWPGTVRATANSDEVMRVMNAFQSSWQLLKKHSFMFLSEFIYVSVVPSSPPSSPKNTHGIQKQAMFFIKRRIC